jgi:hypothetical protein
MTPAQLERARANVRAAAEGREEPYPTEPPRYPCPYCGAPFDQHQALGGHVAQHHRWHAAAPAPAAPRPGRGG